MADSLSPWVTGQVTPQTAQQMSYIYMTFEIRKDGKTYKTWTFLVNPDTYVQTEPIRSNTVQTVGGAYLDSFGRGLPTIQISGVSGWRLRQVTQKGTTDGWQYWQDFLQNVFRFFVDQTNEDDKHEYELRFYNWIDKEYWAVGFTNNLTWKRQAPQDNLWRRYDYTLICLYPLPTPTNATSLRVVGQTVVGSDDSTLSDIVNVDLLSVENDLWNAGVIIKQLVALNNPSFLPLSDRQLLQTIGYYDSIEPSEELTNYNYPGIVKYTGTFENCPANTILYLVTHGVFVLTSAINNYRNGKTDNINVSYGSYITASTSCRMKAKGFNDTLINVYKNKYPVYLCKELMDIYNTMGKLAGHSNLFSS